MTIKEFFESKDKLAIHCNTKEKAKKLLKAFDRAGHCWVTGGCYIEDTAWEIYEEETCYNNTGCYGSTNYFKECHYTIFEFEEIELEDASLESRMEEVDDLISRQAAIEYLQRIIDATNTDGRYNLGFIDGLEFCINHLSTEPSAQSKRKKGKWEWDAEEGYWCSKCKEYAYGCTEEIMEGSYKFCPFCGSENEENQWTEGKE